MLFSLLLAASRTRFRSQFRALKSPHRCRQTTAPLQPPPQTSERSAELSTIPFEYSMCSGAIWAGDQRLTSRCISRPRRSDLSAKLSASRASAGRPAFAGGLSSGFRCAELCCEKRSEIPGALRRIEPSGLPPRGVKRSETEKLVANIRSHYETLSIARDAPPEVIRAAYKALSQKWHPDKNRSSESAEMMQAINVAYTTLSDSAKRLDYDQWLEWEEAARAVPRSQTTGTRAPQPAHERAAPKSNAEPPQAERQRGKAFEIDEQKLQTVRFRPPAEKFHWSRYIFYILFPLYIPIDLWLRKRLK